MAKFNWISRCTGIIIVMLPLLSQAQIVQLTLSPKLTATAEYVVGRPGYPTVLLLHGFLQTRDAPPMSTLGRALSDAGYTILMPTLSLGYSQRTQSLACEAVQKHSLQSETAELALWVEWLNKREHRPITLIGHSNGSTVILNYIAGDPDKNIMGAILTSVLAIKIDALEYKQALEREKSSSQSLNSYRISYCRNYFSTAADYLSFASVDDAKVLSMMHQAKVPLQIIIGSDDKVLPQGWGKQLVSAFPTTIVIKGSGHFFEDAHEFSLLDHVQATLKKWSSPR